MEQPPWALYTRISYARKPDGTIDTLGVERQEPPCRDLVTRWDCDRLSRNPDRDNARVIEGVRDAR